MAANGKRLGFLPGWRILTYVILAFNILMLIWVIAGISSANGTPEDCGSLDVQTCNDAEAVGTGLAVVFLIFLWAAVDVILGIIWLVTNRSKGRPCPHCGHEVKNGVVQCRSCGYDFRMAMQGGQGYGQQPPPYYGGPPQR